MGFSQGHQPIEALSASGPDEPFANRVGRRTSRRRFQYFDPEFRDRLVHRSSSDLLGALNDVEEKHAPKDLYLAGDLGLLERGPRVSVVGSRKATFNCCSCASIWS
jgi:predicted Rossmann fold nucleotide-binding protein DprA/Smf involved in DNA uptake